MERFCMTSSMRGTMPCPRSGGCRVPCGVWTWETTLRAHINMSEVDQGLAAKGNWPRFDDNDGSRILFFSFMVRQRIHSLLTCFCIGDLECGELKKEVQGSIAMSGGLGAGVEVAHLHLRPCSLMLLSSSSSDQLVFPSHWFLFAAARQQTVCNTILSHTVCWRDPMASYLGSTY